MIRKLVGAVAVLAVIGICFASVPSIRIPKVTDQITAGLGGPFYPMSVAGDIMAIGLTNESTSYVSVRRRGPDGMYNEISTIVDSSYISPFTNGEWVVVLNSDTVAKWNFYKIGTEGMNQSFYAYSYSTAGFFSDSYLVAELAGTPNGWDIYAFTDKWDYTGTTVTVGDHQVASSDYMTQDGKFVITVNETNIDIWEFQASGPTFNRIESFGYDNTYNILFLYNGLDTVVTGSINEGDPEVQGVIIIYTKVSGVWTTTQNITAGDLGLLAPAQLSNAGVFVDLNTLVVAAYSDNGKAAASPSGKCVVLTRGADGMWTQAYQLEADPADVVSFGIGTVVNSRKELLVASFNANNLMSALPGYIYATCLTTPINVTCNDMTADCNTVDMSSLYTINSLPACGEINATVVSSTNTDNQMTVEFSFTKLGQSSSCISTVTCQAPPVAAPVGSNTPVNAPTKKASSASVIEFTGAVVLAITLAL